MSQSITRHMKSKFLKLSALGAALTLTVAAGCKPPSLTESEPEQVRPPAKTQNTWGVSDISVLYPLRSFQTKSTQKGLAYLSEGLMSQKQFDAVFRVLGTKDKNVPPNQKSFGLDYSSGGQARFMNQLSQWAVVGFRIESCAKGRAKDACQSTINVIAQPVDPNEKKTADFAMHLIFRPSLSSPELLKDMIRIRNSTAKQPGLTQNKALGVHPILAEEGLDSPFAKALKNDFILKHLRTAKLETIAVSFIEPVNLQPWVFFAMGANDFAVSPDHNIFVFDAATSINDCGAQKGRLVCRRDLTTGKIHDSFEKASANPTGKTPNGIATNGFPYLDDFLSLVQMDRDQTTYPTVKKNIAFWRGIINRIENPKLTGAIVSNCSSCHRALTERVRLNGRGLDLGIHGTAAFAAAPGTGCTPGVRINYGSTLPTINVRMFGYMHSAPVVSNRVANETVVACELLKKSLR